MAIYRVSGQMLQSTLVRDGNSIAFANTANSTATLFVDVANTRVGVNSNVANVTLDVNGNIFALNLSSTGNVTAANINGTVVSASGNVIGGNIRTTGLVTATGNITGGNITTVGLVTATGNVDAGNLRTAGLITATGNVDAGNLRTAGLITATGNITGGNVIVGNILIPSSGNVSIGNVNINNVSTPVANSDAATKFYVDSTIGNIANIGNLTVNNTTISSLNSNLVTFGGTSGIIIPAGNIDQRPSPATTATIRFNTINDTLEIYDGTNWVSGTGDISVITNQTINGDGSTTVFSLDQAATADSILVSINGVVQTPGVDYTTASSPDIITFTTAPAGGDVVQIRFISTTSTVSALYNGTTNINIPTSSGNAVISVGGTSNVLTITSTGITVSGIVKTTPIAVNALPSAATAGTGARAFVTDANTITFYSNVGNGGSNSVPVFSNGTNWLVG